MLSAWEFSFFVSLDCFINLGSQFGIYHYLLDLCCIYTSFNTWALWCDRVKLPGGLHCFQSFQDSTRYVSYSFEVLLMVDILIKTACHNNTTLFNRSLYQIRLLSICTIQLIKIVVITRMRIHIKCRSCTSSIRKRWIYR